VDTSARVAKDRFGRHSAELSLLLWAVWDPIGDVPVDEYERYVPTIWRLLEEHADVAAIADELTKICEGWIELDRGTNFKAAETVSRWWYWRFDYPEELAAENL
jgi:hypothetical protein